MVVGCHVMSIMHSSVFASLLSGCLLHCMRECWLKHFSMLLFGCHSLNGV